MNGKHACGQRKAPRPAMNRLPAILLLPCLLPYVAPTLAGASSMPLDPAAGAVRFETVPDIPAAREAIRAEWKGGALEFDMRGAFAAGAGQVRLRAYVPDPERFAGRSV